MPFTNVIASQMDRIFFQLLGRNETNYIFKTVFFNSLKFTIDLL